MAQDKADGHGQLIATFRLGTGYEVPIDLRRAFSEGIDHLGNAIVGEIMMPAFKRGGSLEEIRRAALVEIDACVKRLSDEERISVLVHLIAEITHEKWAKAEIDVRHKLQGGFG